MSHQFSGRQIGVPFDEQEWYAPVRRDGTQHRGLAGTGGTLEEDIAARSHGRSQELELAVAAHHPGRGHVTGLLAVVDGHGWAI